MKQRQMLGLVVVALAGLSIQAGGQPAFNSGSDGSDGALVVTTTTTLNLPPDGIFNFTTVEIRAGKLLRFNRNGLNTPVYMLATGDIRVDGTIDVSGGSGPVNALAPGEGGPGGFDGGTPGIFDALPSAGKGPGGGLGGNTNPASYNGSAGGGAYGGRPDHVTDKAV